MATKYVQARRAVLEGSISDTATSCTLVGFLDLSGNPILQADIGTIGYATLAPNSDKEEAISFTIDSNGTVDGIEGTAVLTITRGLLGKSPYTTGGTAYAHNGGTEMIISNNPSLLNKLTAKDNDEVVSGSWEFPVPTADQNPATKLYVDEIVTGGAVSQNRVVEAGIAGATIVAGDLVYFNETDVEWKKTAGATATTLNNVKLGIAQGAGADGGSIAGGVLTYGLDSTQTGMTPGVKLYAGDISGSIVESAGTVERVIGFSKSATEIYFDPNFAYLPTSNEKSAMAGGEGYGTPSATNRYITEESLLASGGSGDGSDGALSIGAGVTTVLNTGQIYNFTTIDIDATGTLKFLGNDWIILRATGNVTIAGTIRAKGITIERKDLIYFTHALTGGTPLSELGFGGTGGAAAGGDGGTTSPSDGAGGAASVGTGPGLPGNNGNGTTIGGGGASGSSTEGGTSGAGISATDENGGNGGNGSGDSSDGGSGGAGVGTGNGGNGGNGSSKSGGYGGNGGDSGKLGGNGGNGGEAYRAGRGGNAYANGGNGGDGNSFNNGAYGGRGGDGGEQAGHGGNGAGNDDDSPRGGDGGNGTGGATAFFLYCGGDITLSGAIEAYGGNGGNGGTSSRYVGSGGNGGDGADVFLVYQGTASITGTINNLGGSKGLGGTNASYPTPTNGEDGKDGKTIVAKVIT